MIIWSPAEATYQAQTSAPAPAPAPALQIAKSCEAAGFAAENVAYGMGGGLLQKVGSGFPAPVWCLVISS